MLRWWSTSLCPQRYLSDLTSWVGSYDTTATNDGDGKCIGYWWRTIFRPYRYRITLILNQGCYCDVHCDSILNSFHKIFLLQCLQAPSWKRKRDWNWLQYCSCRVSSIPCRELYRSIPSYCSFRVPSDSIDNIGPGYTFHKLPMEISSTLQQRNNKTPPSWRRLCQRK